MGSPAAVLPREVLLQIFSYLSYEDLVTSIQFVCTWWQQVSLDKALWRGIKYEPCTTGDEMKQLIKMLSISPQLRSLNLISVSVNTELINYITDFCPNLQRLEIFWDSLYNYAEVTMSRPLNQIKKMLLICEEELYMNFQYLDKYFPNLEHLEIPHLRFEIKDLAWYLKKKQETLLTLSVPCGSDDEHCVLPCLSAAVKLKELLLEGLCDGVKSLVLEQCKHLANISSLTIRSSNVGSDLFSVFKLFPNITELELYGCTQSGEDTLRIIAQNCPRLQKLNLPYCHEWHGEAALVKDATLKYAHLLEKLTHLRIYGNSFITDEGITHLQLIPELTHLELRQCDRVTTACLKLICGFSKLEVLKFDLRDSNPLTDLTASDVKNKNIQIYLYGCRDLSWLESLRRLHLRVCAINYVYS